MNFPMQRRADNDFVLFSSHGESPQLQELTTPTAAPKLNAQTLFAFGTDAISSPFTNTESRRACNAPSKGFPQNPWEILTPDLEQLKEQ